MKTLDYKPLIIITRREEGCKQEIITHTWQPKSSRNALELTRKEWEMIVKTAKDSLKLEAFAKWLDGKFIKIVQY